MKKINPRSGWFWLGVVDLIAGSKLFTLWVWQTDPAFQTINVIHILHYIGIAILFATGIFYILGNNKRGNIAYFTSLPFRVSFYWPTIPFIAMYLVGNRTGALIINSVIELARLVLTIKYFRKTK